MSITWNTGAAAARFRSTRKKIQENRKKGISLQARKRVGRPPLKNQGSSLTAPGTWDIVGL